MHLSLAGPGAIAINWVTARQSDSFLQTLSRRILKPLRSLGKHGCSGVSLVQYGFSSGDYTNEIRGEDPSCYSVDDYDSGVLHEVIIGHGEEGERGHVVC